MFFNNYGVVFVEFPIEDPPKDKDGNIVLKPIDRFFKRQCQFFLGKDAEGKEPKDRNVHAFQQWLDKQYGVAPSAAECRLTVTQFGESYGKLQAQ